MGHKILIDGVAYDITGGRCLVDGVGYNVQKGRTLIDGVGYDVAFGPSGIPAGDIAVGSSVYANVNGVRKEFLVVHQGIPNTTIYDASCNGTWLLMKDIYEERVWDDDYSNLYANSAIHSYLNSDFLNLFDGNVKTLIKSVKIPYGSSASSANANQGANGLAARIFLLAGRELKFTTAYLQTGDGATLDYFSDCATEANDTKRIAYLNGTAKRWALRSIHRNSGNSIHAINTSGARYEAVVSSTTKFGIRPAFILDSSAVINPDTFDILV